VTELGDWTILALKEHFDELRDADREAVKTALDAAEKAVNAALISSEKAILKAEDAASDRFKAGNEIRQAMVDAQAHFAPREDSDRRLKALERQAWMLSGVLAFVTVAMAAIGLLFMIFGPSR
jgi:hypothetical protein